MRQCRVCTADYEPHRQTGRRAGAGVTVPGVRVLRAMTVTVPAAAGSSLSRRCAGRPAPGYRAREGLPVVTRPAQWVPGVRVNLNLTARLAESDAGRRRGAALPGGGPAAAGWDRNWSDHPLGEHWPGGNSDGPGRAGGYLRAWEASAGAERARGAHRRDGGPARRAAPRDRGRRGAGGLGGRHRDRRPGPAGPGKGERRVGGPRFRRPRRPRRPARAPGAPDDSDNDSDRSARAAPRRASGAAARPSSTPSPPSASGLR